MRNGVHTAVRLRRIDICDLMLACTCAEFSANDGGEKWKRLREELRKQLEELDEELDMALEYER